HRTRVAIQSLFKHLRIDKGRVMPFSVAIKQEAILKSRRHCCFCKKWAGRNIEVHHLIQEADGGSNEIDNAIVLCFDCHADAGHYNPHHPLGNKIDATELRKNRDEWWKWCEEHLFDPLPDDPIRVSPSSLVLEAGDWKSKKLLKVVNRTSDV